MRNEKIKNLLVMVGADASSSTIAMIDNLIGFIPTNYLKHFTEYVLKNYDKYKKPIVNITTASQEYKKQLSLALIKRGEKKFNNVEETKAFILEFFKGQNIANCITGLYKDFVTIALTQDGELLNKYSFNKLDSHDSGTFWHWCFLNQHQIGNVEIIETETAKKMIENHNRHFELLEQKREEENQNTSQILNKKVRSFVNASVKGVG